jgi:hypothetical protein
MKQNGIQLLGANEIPRCKGRKNLCRGSGTGELNTTGYHTIPRSNRVSLDVQVPGIKSSEPSN